MRSSSLSKVLFLHNCIPENLIMAKEPQQKREEEMVPTFPKQFIITCLRYSSPYMCINTDDCLFLTCAPLIKCLLLHNILFQQICDKSWAFWLALCIVMDVICESGADVYIRCPVTLCPGNYYITIYLVSETIYYMYLSSSAGIEKISLKYLFTSNEREAMP